MTSTTNGLEVPDRLNPRSILVCNLALIECGGEMINTPKSIMEHMINNHGWRKVPEMAQEDIDQKKPHPKTKEIMTEESYLKFIDEHPEEWWLDMQFIWTDIRNIHFLHKNSKGVRSLRSYYHEC
uniref:ORF52 n=1 Tax=Nitrosopumilaceae spindle-shaped virus TaxID=3065433 RepID=A0AAT9J7K5_9VIRU